MKWIVPENALDTDQRDFIDNEAKRPGNVWVQGFAGSGKSVLLVHALRDVLRTEPNARVLLVVYTLSLVDMFKTGLKELGIPANVPVKTFYDFYGEDNQYDYIFCDEVQDLPSRVLHAMKSRSKKVIVAGDSNQSIFDKDPKWSEPTITPGQIGDVMSARAFSLNMVHRLTRSIIAAVQKLMPAMNIWGARRDVSKVDINIKLCEAANIGEEVKYISDRCKEATGVSDSCAILLPLHDNIAAFIETLLSASGVGAWTIPKNKWGGPDYNAVNAHLRSCGLKWQVLGNGYGSLQQADQAQESIIMTYHSAKGLDFDNVFLPFLNNNFSFGGGNANAHTLFMVGMTRSKKNLYITYSGVTHDLVDKFKTDCSKITIADTIRRTTTTANSNSFDF